MIVRLMAAVVPFVAFVMVPGSVSADAHQSARPAQRINPQAFALAPSDFPAWAGATVAGARVEGNARAHRDAVDNGNWNQLGRVTGWFEYIELHQGAMSPEVDFLVSEFRSSVAARRAYTQILAGSSDKPTAYPRIGWRAAEWAVTTKPGARKRDVVTIWMQYQSFDLDVWTVEDHAPQVSFLSAYQLLTRATARRLIALIDHPRQSPPLAGPSTAPFSVTAWLSPSDIVRQQTADIYAHAVPGAHCTNTVRYYGIPEYDTGKDQVADQYGTVDWTDKMTAKAGGGWAVVTCTLNGQVQKATTTFRIFPASRKTDNSRQPASGTYRWLLLWSRFGCRNICSIDDTLSTDILMSAMRTRADTCGHSHPHVLAPAPTRSRVHACPCPLARSHVHVREGLELLELEPASWLNDPAAARPRPSSQRKSAEARFPAQMGRNQM